MAQTKTNKTLTKIGERALDYIADPASFPADCPDPRQDAEGFAEWIRKNE